MTDYLYQDITYDIRGACFWVWKEFGGAFKEKIVENALALELGKRNRSVERQKRINIYYLKEKVGTYIPDMIVDSTVLVELKCKPMLVKQDMQQFWTYLKGSDCKLGLLINFGRKLEIERRVYDEARQKRDQRSITRSGSASDLALPSKVQ
jgi:GxxExxY protein